MTRREQDARERARERAREGAIKGVCERPHSTKELFFGERLTNYRSNGVDGALLGDGAVLVLVLVLGVAVFDSIVADFYAVAR